MTAAGCVALLVSGCTWDGSLPTPDPTDDPDRAAAELASGLSRRDLTTVEFSGATGTEVNAEFQPLVTGMASLKPRVSVAGVDVQGDAATVNLDYAWTFPGAGAAPGPRRCCTRDWTGPTGSASGGWPLLVGSCSGTEAKRS
jgi:hypothetical protein